MSSEASNHHVDHEETVIETLKSLVMAFVLAMTFRGFVTEGFVIPTGSMAPTLMGQHAEIHSDMTGSTFRVGIHPSLAKLGDLSFVADPMLGPDYRGAGITGNTGRKHMGDRILVIKTLYPFFMPKRFDVVVFKNPTEPVGDSSNYIKRLIGLPNEKIWLVDGDVFAGPADTPDRFDDYQIQRKPEHVQRAVWQTVYDSDYIADANDRMDIRHPGSPWRGDGWQTLDTRVYRCDTAEYTMLRWDEDIRGIDDWTAYNQAPSSGVEPVGVSDVRISAGFVPDQEGFQTTLELITRSHMFEFTIAEGKATIRMRPLDESTPWIEASQPVSLPGPGKVFSAEFWHVDQALAIYIDGKKITSLEYDWLPDQRLRYSTGLLEEEDANRLVQIQPDSPIIRWHFSGSPVSLHRVKLDRDLYYRQARQNTNNHHNPPTPGFEDLLLQGSPGFGTHPTKPAVLGPDHFFMLGDNSARSLDGRVWGSPHPLIATQIDPSPFVVHRRLLIGKAWVVYFPSTYSLTKEGKAIIPDFGRMRFIR